MKKSICIIALTGFFVTVGTDVSAQGARAATVEAKAMVSKAVATELETATNDAITVVNNDKKLTADDKKKFETRIQTILRTAKTKDDKKAKLVYAESYNRLAANYNRITGNKLPDFKPTTAAE